MRVIRAQAMGMCFGVKAAIERALRVDSPDDVTVRGELVHNPAVLRQLSSRGLRQQTERERDVIPATDSVLITAHGTSDRRRRELNDAGKRVIDTTCPLVAAVHRAALELAADGRLVVVVGRPGHVEVVGVVEDLPRAVVVDDPEEVAAYDEARLGIVSQSTTAPDRFARVVAEIRRRNPEADLRVVDTICAPTRDRQRALLDLLPAVEALVVVGGPSSNNSRALCRLAEARGVPARLCGDADDLDEAWLRRFEVVGLTAGTSTRDEEIDAVHRALTALVG